MTKIRTSVEPGGLATLADLCDTGEADVVARGTAGACRHDRHRPDRPEEPAVPDEQAADRQAERRRGRRWPTYRHWKPRNRSRREEDDRFVRLATGRNGHLIAVLSTRPAPQQGRTVRRLTSEDDARRICDTTAAPETVRHALLAAALDKLGETPEQGARIWIPVDFAMTRGDRRQPETTTW